MKKNFALIGVAGYIAPRHLKAIKESGNELVAAVDPHDSVGLLDGYFDDVSFFTEFERFDRHIERVRRESPEQKIDYVSICSPNHLHDAHIRFALRVGADAICEKPVVLNPWNCDALLELEQEFGKKVYTILQLRHHPSLIELRNKLNQEPARRKKHKVVLTYITPRGLWYQYSWKGQKEKSGGVATNIGIHMFDLLIWLFGDVQGCQVHYENSQKISGHLELERAEVQWFLSVDRKDMPEGEEVSYRLISIDGQAVEFSPGFRDLHTICYQELLAGRGFGLLDAKPSIELCSAIRLSEPVGVKADSHPFLKGAAGK
jgi:UDP-N-acetyl-2-amino-2-deoxyglucuronate dehydrogenase